MSENIRRLATAYSGGSQIVRLGSSVILRIGQRCLELLKSSNVNQPSLPEHKN